MATPLMLYAGLRVGVLIAGRGKRILWAACFVLLVLGYPLAERMERAASGPAAMVLMSAAYMALPYVLYLVLIVIATDAVFGLARVVKLVSRETVRKPGFRKARAAGLLLAPLLIVAWGAGNFNRLKIREYAIELPRKEALAAELMIVFASDFHLQERTPARLMDRFARKVNAVHPDLVLIGGDVVEGGTREEHLEGAAEAFRRIRSRYGIYGVLGNHDSFGGGAGDFFDQAGIRLLTDEVVRIDDAVRLAGRRDGRSRGGTATRRPIDDLLAGVPEDLPIVVLDHRPTDLDNVGRSRADLQLSGHTHNAQIFPLNFAARRQYEIAWGYGRKGGAQVIVSSGVQGWGPPVRTAGASEILVIRISFKDPS